MAISRVNDVLWAVRMPVCSDSMVYLPANVQRTTHRIAEVMANIRYRPAIAADEPTGRGAGPGPEIFKICKNVKLSCQMFTPANDHANHSVSQGESQKIHQSPQIRLFSRTRFRRRNKLTKSYIKNIISPRKFKQCQKSTVREEVGIG